MGVVAITTLAVVVHEVPQEVADYAVLRAAHIGKRRARLLGARCAATRSCACIADKAAISAG